MNLSKSQSRLRLLQIILSGLLFAVIIFHFTSRTTVVSSGLKPLAQNVPTPAKIEPTKPGLPTRLKIPSINVDSFIEAVGLTPQGEMGVPKGPTNSAWYKLGPRPGEIGSAVIDGHFGWKDGVPAVFDDLYKLHKGDKLSVQDEKGVTTTFVVRESRSFDPEADASGVFRSTDSVAHLNLVTCEGSWNATSKNYSKRLVVFADKE